MRIHRIHLQHVAGVDDRELAFGDGVTVVVGPNEAGKSTIPTALQLLLDEKDRYDNADIRAVRPVHVDADPTIELECTTGPYHVTYRKCFGSTASRRETTLTIHAPAPASLTGDAAHERMTAILEETVDEQLWSALRVQQRHDVGQADLTTSGALAAALDAAGTGAATLTDHDSLVTRVVDDAAQFWTDTGRQRKPLNEADATVEAASTALAAARTRLAEVRDATTRHDRLVEQIGSWRSAVPDLETHAKDTAAALAEVTEQRDALRGAERRRAQAEAGLVRARDAVADRQMLLQRIDDLGDVVTTRGTGAERARGAVDRAEAHATQARADRDEARRLVDEARRAVRTAEADVRLLRLDADVEQLSVRISQAERLHERREAAKARLDDRAPSAAAIRRLESLDETVRTTAAVLEADLPRLRIDGPADADVAIGDEPLTLADSEVERAIEGPVVVHVGPVTVTVAPGSSAADLAAAHSDAVHRLRTALDEAGVDDLAGARTRREEAQAARRDLEQTDADWQRLTSVDGLDGLRASLARTTSTGATLRAERPVGHPLPDDVAHAEQVVAARQAELERTQADLARAETALESATTVTSNARTAAAEATARHESTVERLEEVTQQLAAARDAATDGELREVVAIAEREVGAAGRAVRQIEAALSAIDVATIEADAEAASTRLHSTRQRLQEAEVDRAELWGQIEASASAGLGQKVPQLEATLADAEARRDALRHRAEALLLLRDTLRTHRDEARARYQAPLKAEVERLGRVVFGDDFAIELDESLRVVARTLGGRTLALEQLSGGAQEQLAIITRLAAASLVDPEDGVPLILDDALGYADPTRTDRVNTLLARVGQGAQVIVLTCDPDRFAGVADATLEHIG